MDRKLRINFTLPPIASISGGPLAILEYANRFMDRGHEVSVTTYPDSMWAGDDPFPWFKFKGIIHYKRMRGEGGGTSISEAALRMMNPSDFKALANVVFGNFGVEGFREAILESCDRVPDKESFRFFIQEILAWLYTIEATPDCDLNIATFWSTAFPVFFSRRGKPVYFMQHYEEIFYPLQPEHLLQRLVARMSYSLPLYKVANSSWLQRIMKQNYDQAVPFSVNGIDIADFNPREKRSSKDGIVRVVTYSRPEEWKGFGDAVAAMSRVIERFGNRVEWNVFGYRHPHLTETNAHAPYTLHPKLSFSQLAALYASSDIALCPPWYESFPLPPLEAMASGTATITTRYGTEEYAFHEQNALVIGPRKIDDMYQAICRLVEDPDLRDRLAKAGRNTAEELTWDRAVIERERILLDIHAGRTTYNINRAAQLRLADGAGLEFECAPADIDSLEPGLFWHQGRLYLQHEGAKRHVVSEEMIAPLLQRDFAYLEIDDLNILRLPYGPPIVSESDLPNLHALTAS